MNASLSRDFSAPWQSRVIQDVIQSLLIAELIAPSKELWLMSGWITNLDMLDNGARAFAGVRPDWPAETIGLTRILHAIVERGGHVAVVVRDVEHNLPFLRSLRDFQADAHGRLGIAVSASAHEKALVGDDYVLGGSMNLTHNGLNVSDEHMLLRVDRAAASSRRLALKARWEGEMSWR